MATTPNTSTTVEATVADDHRRAMCTYHRPGCAHLRTLEALSTGPRSIADLRAFEAEAKELGTPNPVAPCLRAAIR